DGNGSHASTLKSPSYTKSVSWQHYPEKPPPQEVVFYCAQKNPETSERFRILTQPLDRSTDP
ncbi:hypothetical protein LAV75_21350, partial [Shigella flexneri]